MKKIMVKMKKIVSLYSGAGGLDFGFAKAGFQIIWANDIDKDACQTYEKNIGNHIRCGDVNDYLNELKSIANDTDVLIGGPPCQGFSVAGKMDPHDPRSQNVWTFIRILELLSPQAFVMENVKALGVLEKWSLLRQELVSRMRQIGYSANYVIVNASDFGVPQSRERVFFIGFKMKNQIIPNLDDMLEPFKVKSKTVREALKILDKAGSGNNKNICKAKITLTPKPVLRKSP